MEITNIVVEHREDALLVGDYHTYQARLTRKLHSLRKKLGQTSHNGKKYHSKAVVTADDVVKDNSYVYLPLLAAERAWATAMQMKSVHSADPSSKGIVGSTRRHIISRLHKAVTHAQQLIPLFESGTKLDLLEVRGYVASLQGAYWMEKQRWDQCLQQYSLAHIIYTVLGNRNPQRTAIPDLVEGTIVPGLRYAAYQLQIPRTTSLDTLAKQHFPQETRNEIEAIGSTFFSESNAPTVVATSQNTASRFDCPRAITWRNRTVKIEDSNISLSLGAIAAAEAELTSYLKSTSTSDDATNHTRRATWYDRVIICSQDAVDATKVAIEELTAEGVDQSDKRMQALQVTRTAVNYRLVAWRIGRNRVATGPDDGLTLEDLTAPDVKPIEGDDACAKAAAAAAAKKAAKQTSVPKRMDVLRRQAALYDATLQDLDAVKELPGVMGDEELVAELEAKKSYFQALRCVAVARSHSIVSKPQNALALLMRASKLAEQSAPLSRLRTPEAEVEGTNTPLRLTISRSQLETLNSRLTGLILHHQGLCELYRLKETASKVDQRNLPPLIERLDTYPLANVDLHHLVNFPPKMQPIPVKPLFLDIAYNYLEYPGTSTTTAMNTSTSGSAAQSRSGMESNRAVEGAAAAASGKNAGGTAAAESGDGENRQESVRRRGWFGFGRR
ncbi:hypothetical protein KEM54_006119 [Ascosphaera aggregata]|nr:hypothetical protein KEM54_006119 [Ascosphaera aggregata]